MTMGRLKRIIKKELEKVEEVLQPESEPEVIKPHGEVDPDYNCPACIGDGIIGNTICVRCFGTGKVS